jgi:hypothetical protein
VKIVYKLTPDFAMQTIGMDCEQADWDVLYPATYAPAAMRKLTEWDLFILDPRLPRGDFLSVGALFCASERLCQQLDLHRHPDLELVPIKLRDETNPCFALSIRHFIAMEDIVDDDQCDYETFPDGTTDSLPIRWAFRPERIAGPMIFQLAGLRSHTLCACADGSGFHEEYVRRGLTGIKFRELWRWPAAVRPPESRDD